MITPSEPHIERDLLIENADVQQEHIITQICPWNWFVTIDLKGVLFIKECFVSYFMQDVWDFSAMFVFRPGNYLWI